LSEKTSGFSAAGQRWHGTIKGGPSRYFSKILAKIHLQRSVEPHFSAAAKMPRKNSLALVSFSLILSQVSFHGLIQSA
jgi:hypothetical protein